LIDEARKQFLNVKTKSWP